MLIFKHIKLGKKLPFGGWKIGCWFVRMIGPGLGWFIGFCFGKGCGCGWGGEGVLMRCGCWFGGEGVLTRCGCCFGGEGVIK